jgi:hypothetical protein
MSSYDQLIKVIEKSLYQSSDCVDTRTAVKQCYGDDISMFSTASATNTDNATNATNATNNAQDDDGIEMLASLINNILEKINDAFLQNELNQILDKEKVKLKLDTLDQVVEEFISNQRRKDEQERLDIQSARDAIRNTQFLPQGMDMSHVMLYQSYRMKMKIRDELLAELENVEKESNALLGAVEREKQEIKNVVTENENDVVVPLNRNADVCSFNGIS